MSADREAAAALAQQACTPDGASSPNAEPPGQHHRVDALDRAVRLEQIGFARARRAAADVDRRDRRFVEHDGGDAGGEPRVVGVTDTDAGNVGDEIAL